MEKKHLIISLAVLILSFSLVMTGCKNDDDDSSGNEISESQLVLNSAALSIIRGLCALDTDDDLNATNSAEEKGNGIEVFPDDWQSRTFKPDQGFVLNDKEPGVRSMPCAGADEARDYVSSLVGEAIETNSYSWIMPGLGKLTFNVAANADADDTQLYATLDVEIPVIPDLTQLRFVPVTVVDKESPENGFSGSPYFPAGSLIKRKSDNTIWLCIRPSGGSLWKKDSGYWICLHGQDKNMNFVLKGQDKSMLTQTSSTQTKSEKWTFAKGLMSEKTAKTAAHTLNCLARADVGGQNGLLADRVYEDLKEKGFDLRLLWKNATQTAYEGFDRDKEPFYIAYGSAKKDSKRITGTGSKANANNNFVQPYLKCKITPKGNRYTEEMTTYYGGSSKNFLYSATDSHDLKAMETMASKSLFEPDWNRQFFLNTRYTYTKKVMSAVRDSRLGFYSYSASDDEKTIEKNIIFSPELKIKDNKGPDVCPVKESAYEVLYRPTVRFEFWETLGSFNLTVNGKEIAWKKITS